MIITLIFNYCFHQLWNISMSLTLTIKYECVRYYLNNGMKFSFKRPTIWPGCVLFLLKSGFHPRYVLICSPCSYHTVSKLSSNDFIWLWHLNFHDMLWIKSLRFFKFFCEQFTVESRFPKYQKYSLSKLRGSVKILINRTNNEFKKNVENFS